MADPNAQDTDGQVAQPDDNRLGSPGLLVPGTIKNLWDRPILKNDDGSYSTTQSFSFGTDKGETLIPQVVDGKRLTREQAIDRYRKTGEHLGIFDTPEHADAYATKLHNEQDLVQGPQARGADQPMPEVTVSAKRGEKPQPTQDDLDYLTAHPEAWQKFEDHFGELPKGWRGQGDTAKPQPSPEDLAYLKAHPDAADKFKAHFGELPEGFKKGQASWGDVATAAQTNVGAGIERVGAAAEEWSGQGAFNNARAEYWKGLTLPGSIEWAKRNGKALTDDPGLQQAAEHVYPDLPKELAWSKFAQDWQRFDQMDPKDREAHLQQNQAAMQEGMAKAQSGAKRRQLAGQTEQAFAPLGQTTKLQDFSLNMAAAAPELLGGAAISMIPGGAIPAAALLGSDFALRGYSQARDAGLSDQQAKMYGVLSGAATAVPEVPVWQALSKAPGANLVLSKVLGAQFAETAMGKAAGATLNQAMTMTVQNALQAAIDKGTIDKNMTLGDALKSLGQGFLSGTVIGGAMHGMHVGTRRLAYGAEPKAPKTPADIQDENAHQDLVQQDQEAKQAEAEGKAKEQDKAKGEEEAEPRSAARDANVAALQKLTTGEQLTDTEKDTLVKSGLATVGGKTGRVIPSPAGRRLMTEAAREPKEPDALAPPKADRVTSAPGGEERDVDEAAAREARAPKPSEAEDQAAADTRRTQAFEQAEAPGKAKKAADVDRAYADQRGREGAEGQRDFQAAKNKVAEETIEQAPHAQKDPGAYLTLADAMEVTKQKAVDIAAQIPRMPDLDPAGREIESNLVDKIANNPQAAIDEYNRLPDTMGGKIISTDEARHLSEEYTANPNLSQEVHEPASWFANMLFKRMLAQPPKPGEDNLVTFTAGGTGSGKSSTLLDAGPLVRKSQLIFDTVLNGKNTAEDKIQAALDAGKWVSVAYVYRGVKEAFENGTLFRANLNGRVVPAQVHLDTHSGAPEALWHLMDKFRDDPRVAFVGIDNTGGDGNAKLADIESLLKRNHDEHATFGQLRAIGKEMLADGKITPEIYERTFGERPPTSAHGEDVSDGARDGGQAQPEHGRPAGERAEARGEERPALSDREKEKLAREEARARRQLERDRMAETTAPEEVGSYSQLADRIRPGTWLDWNKPGVDRALSAHDVLDEIAAARSQDPRISNIIDALRRYVPKDVGVRFTDQLINPVTKQPYPKERKATGLYWMDDRTVQVLRRPRDMRGAQIAAVLHELVHAATMHELYAHPDGPLAKKLQALLNEARSYAAARYGKDLVQQHVDFWSGVSRDRPEHMLGDLYGLTNIKEFAAEGLTNHRFQEMLDAITPPMRMNTTPATQPTGMFRKFVQAIRDFLTAGGKGVNTSLLEDLISTTGEVMKAQELMEPVGKRFRDAAAVAFQQAMSDDDHRAKLARDIADDIEKNRNTRFVKQAASLGALKMIRGVVGFDAWSEAMVGEFGKEIKPALRPLFQLSKDAVPEIRNVIKERKSGEVVGAPKGTTKADIAPLRQTLRKLAREGEYGRFWYEKSGQAFLDAAGGNKADARVLVGLHAIFSAGAAVTSNTTMGLRAYYQYKAGEPIKVGTGDLNEIAQTFVDTGKLPDGIKQGSFYGNIIDEIDGDLGHVYGDGTTVDRWMMRVAGFAKEAPTDAQYGFVSQQVGAVAKQLGWKTKQAQAAIWVSIKARWEKVQPEVRKYAMEQGWIKRDPKARGGIRVLNKEQYYGYYLDQALKATVTPDEIKRAARDFSDTLRDRRLQVSWEAMPGVGSGRLRGADQLPLHVLNEFQTDVSRAHANPLTGNDELRESLGLLSAGTVIGNSAWFRDPGQVMRFRHWGPESLEGGTLDPARQGTGAAGQITERNRSNKVVSLYPFEYGPGQPEEQVKAGRHEYIVEVPATQMYDAVRDPRGFKDMAQEPVGFDFQGNPTDYRMDHDAFETAIKDAGYAGYYVSKGEGEMQDGQARLFQRWPAVRSEHYRGNESLDLYTKSGAQEEIYAPPAKKAAEQPGATIDPAARAAVEAYAAALGTVNHQDAVGWHIPRFGATKGASNGVEVRLPNATPEDFQAAYKAVHDAMRAQGMTEEAAAQFAPIQSPDGFRFINWGQMDNLKFQDTVRSALGGRKDDMFPAPLAGRAEFTNFAAEGGLINAADYERIIAGHRNAAGLRRAIGNVSQRVEPAYRALAERYGLSDAARAPSARQGEKAQVDAPISVDRLLNGGAHDDILSRFGKVGGEPLEGGMKHYPIDPKVHGPVVDKMTTDMGFTPQLFSFEEDKAKGVEFRIPQLGKRGYDAGNLWIYDPKIENASFHDSEYTRIWRTFHELGHAITEPFMQQRYGDSRRFGALGRETMQTRGTLGKQKQVPVRGLTLAEAQRAIEWEDVAFRAQRMLMDKAGIRISDADFAREYNLNMADALYRVTTGDFSDPFSTGFNPSDQIVPVRDVLRALERTEMGLAQSQNRRPTDGFDLQRWTPISENQIRQSVEARQNNGDQTKFSVRSSDDFDYRVSVSDRDGSVSGPHDDLLFANREDAQDHVQTLAEQRAAQVGGQASHEELWSSTRAGGKADRTFSIQPVHRDPYKAQQAPQNRQGPAENFMDEWRSKFPEAGIGGPGDRLINGNVMAGMVNDVVDTSGHTLYMTSLLSMEPGSGAGTKAMREIIGMADKHGATIELSAVAFGHNGPRQADLEAWYKKAGFVEVARGDGGGTLMRREPVKGGGIVPKFSTNDGKGISAEDAAKVIQHAQAMFPHAQHHMLESIEDAPHEVQAQAAAQGVTDRVEAAIHHDYDGTHVYLIRQNARSVESALQTLVEEHVGHAGVRGTFGEGMGAIMDGFLRNMEVRAKIAQAAKQWGLPTNHPDPVVRKEAWRAAAEEWLAHVASKDVHTNLERGKLLEAVTSMKFWLTKLGVPLKLSEADAHSALARAHQFVTNSRWGDNVVAQKEENERQRVGALFNVIDFAAAKAQREQAAAQAEEKGKLEAFNQKLIQDVKDRAAANLKDVMALNHKYKVGDTVTSANTGKAYRIIGLAGTKGLPTDAGRIEAGISHKQIRMEQASRGMQPAYYVRSLEDGSEHQMAEWGMKEKFEGPKAVKFSVVPPSGNADLDEALNEKIGTTPTGWRTRLSHAMQDWRAKRVVMNLDRLYRLKQYEDDLKIPPAESGYISQRLATSVAPLLRVAMEWGGLKWTPTAGFDPDKSMMPDYDSKVKPLNTILAPLHNDPAMLRRFEGYLVGLRSRELAAQGRENLMEQRHITALIDQAKQYPHFVQMQKDIAALNKNILDFAEKAGVIDPESRKMWESDYYVPFYRVMDDAGAGPWGQGNLARVRNPIVRLMGGKENINDVTANIARNMATLINASVKAHAMRVAVDNLSAAGVAVRVPSLERGRDALVSTSEINKILANAGITQKLSPSAIGGIQKLISLTTPQGDDIVQVWRGGKREYYRIDDPLLMVGINAMKQSQTKALGEFFNALTRTPAMVFTKLTTENPAFGIRTLWKDNINAWTVGRGAMPVTPVVSAITGLAKTGAGKSSWASESFRRMSAAGATFNAGRADPYDTNLSVRRYMTKPGTKWIPGSGMALHLWDGYRDLMLSGENASRVTIYERTLKETGSQKLAAYEARDLMDYAMRGASPIVQFFVETVPFWGAHLQGMYKTARATAGGDIIGNVAKQVTTRVIKYGLLSLAASALYMNNRQRDDYNDLPPIQKELYYHLYLGGHHIKIPKAFESGTLFGTVPEAMTEALMSKFDPQTVKEQTEYVAHAFLSALNLAPIPMVVKPLIESFANKDIATGYPILSEHDQGVLPGEQYGPRTSPLVTGMARHMPESASWLSSPKQFQHLLLGYTGVMGSYILNAADYGYRLATGMPAAPDRNLAQIPVVGSFATRTDEPATSTRSLGALSDVMIESNKLQKSIHDLETKGDPESIARAEQYTKDRIDMIVAGAAMKPASDAIRELRNAQQLVQNDTTMSAADKKKQLNEIQDAINKTARDVYEYRPGGKMNREILESITPKATPQAKANVLKKNDMPALASIALQYGTNKMPARVQAAIEELG